MSVRLVASCVMVFPLGPGHSLEPFSEGAPSRSLERSSTGGLEEELLVFQVWEGVGSSASADFGLWPKEP